MLQKHESEIEKHIEHLENHKNELKRDSTYARYAYVTYEDLEYLNKNRMLKAKEESDREDNESSMGSQHEIDDRNKEMILAIRAPYGSTLEIPLES